MFKEFKIFTILLFTLTNFLYAQLSGIKTIGSSGEYQTLTAAVSAISSQGLSGPIILELLSTYNSSSETFPIDLSSLPTDATKTITIRPAAGVTSALISGSNTTAIITLSSNYVTIDGRAGGTGSDKNLTIRNSANAKTIGINNSQNCSIKYCILEGAPLSSSQGIVYLDANNNSILIENSDIKNIDASNKPYNGIYLKENTNNSITISKCKIYNFNSAGININNSGSLTISENEIYEVEPAIQSFVYGVYINQTSQCNIFKNKIYNLTTNSTGSPNIKGIYVSYTSNVSIYNNVISIGPSIKANIYGIDYNATSSSNVSIYFNTIYIYGTLPSSVLTDYNSYGISKRNVSNAFNIKNNIVFNARNKTDGYSKNFAIYVSNTTGTLDFNYNDYYVTGTGGVLGYWNNSDRSNLALWKSSSGKDANSISQNPNFISVPNDLRIHQGSPVLAAGTPISGITDDIEGNSRNETTPSIGAYENAFVPTNPPNCANLISPNDGATIYTVKPTLQWSDGGGGTFGYKLYFGTDNPPTNILNGTDLGGATSYQFSTNLNYSTTYYWKVIAYNSAGDASGCEIRSFTTGPNPAVIPYHVTFNDQQLPYGWEANPAVGQIGSWKFTNSPSNPSAPLKSGPLAYYNCFSYLSGTSGLFILPKFNFPNENYRIYFWMYRDDGYSNSHDKIDVWINTTNDTVNGTKIGTINRLRTHFPTVNANGWYFYEFNLPSGTSGEKYLIIRGYSRYGNNIFIDEVGVSAKVNSLDTTTINGGDLTPVDFAGPGVKILFNSSQTNLGLRVEKISSPPGYTGSLPSGVINIAPVYYKIEITKGSLNGNYSITINTTSIPGIQNPSALRLLKRANPTEAWTDLGTPSNVSGNEITWSNISGFSEFGIGGDNQNPLPVELSMFTARVIGRNVNLNWTSATELNFYGYEIERKKLGSDKDWDRVGYIKAAGNSSKPTEYNFVDEKLNFGKYAYRLKMIDYDGKYSYSQEVTVEIAKPYQTKIEQNYPNSFNPTTKIEYQLANPSKIRIEVFSISGEKVAELINKDQEEGYYSLTFDANVYGLASGVYLYRMSGIDKTTGKSFTFTKKMILVK
jgi:hypothetical protein